MDIVKRLRALKWFVNCDVRGLIPDTTAHEAADQIEALSARIAALKGALRLFCGHMEADTFGFGDNPSDCYEAARRALAAMPDDRASAWRTMDSVDQGSGAEILVGRWAECETGPVWCQWVAFLDTGPLGYDGIEGEPPTHWQPLPAPPGAEHPISDRDSIVRFLRTNEATNIANPVEPAWMDDLADAIERGADREDG